MNPGLCVTCRWRVVKCIHVRDLQRIGERKFQVKRCPDYVKGRPWGR